MADVAPLVEAAADPLIAEWLSEIPQPYSTEDGQAWVAAATAGLTDNTAANLAVTSGGRLVGAVGLRFDPADPKLATIGYWTAAAARRRRVATRAVQAISTWGMDALGIRRIEIYAAADNLGSRGVAEAAGFEQEGLLRAWRVVHGKPTDFALYAQVASG
jgi:RimJ/RimL family protein N-acetyltransferase